MTSYGEFLRKVIRQSGYSVQGFADEVGICRGHLAGIINGSTLPSYSAHQRICKALYLAEDFYKVVDDIYCEPRFVFKETGCCRRSKHTEYPRGKGRCKKG